MKLLLLTGLLSAVSLLVLPNMVHASVSVGERALVIVSELDGKGARELQPLYASLEQLTRITAQAMLSDKYGRIEILADRDASFANFKNTLLSLSQDRNIKAIDVIMSLHGDTGALVFDDGTWQTSVMETRFLLAINRTEKARVMVMRKKLRTIYNLSCFGSSHRTNFINMGFDSVNGSINVNANSEVEFVPALIAWRSGVEFKTSFNASNNDLALAAADGPIRLAGEMAGNSLKNTNSKKLFSGDVTVKINSDAK